MPELLDAPPSSNGSSSDHSHYRVIRRDGRDVPFMPDKIAVALGKAFAAAQDEPGELTARARDLVQQLTANVVASLTRRRAGGAFHIEEIQDQVELELMRAEEYKVARRYVVYREERAKARDAAAKPAPKSTFEGVRVQDADGNLIPLDNAALQSQLDAACAGLEHVDASGILEETLSGLYDGIPRHEVSQAAIMAARARVETAPEYAFVAARLLLDSISGEVLQSDITHARIGDQYVTAFADYIENGVQAGRLSPVLQEFDLARIGAALRPERDLQFQYMGLQTLYDRYLIHIEGRRIELPQWFWMRIAMGLAQREIDRETRAIEFYEIISQFRFVPSTPTLFNSGTCYPQLSSCYLTTIGDDLSQIFDGIRDNALLSKFSGGLGNDWTPVRALGAPISSTNGKSQGLVPFLKVANDTAVAVNQGGKRQGAVCAYIETWHLDVEEFLDLRRNTGDDRRRTHDMHTALWVPDLLLQRVQEEGQWTLFSPDEVPDLHDLYGKAFKERYAYYEAQFAEGKIRNARTVAAVDLWRKVLTRLFETGHPWLTFKDAANLRSPQQHIGVVHSSNLCTEITLNTSREEIAVCNLGSVNLAAHTTEEGIDHDKLGETVATAMRMLDNVIDINLYPVPEARASNVRHRPVGLGVMGFQDALYKQHIPFASEAAVAFADTSMEAVAYHSILASARLAAERGAYASYKGSLWDRGILPVDTLQLMDEARDVAVEVDRSASLDWTPVREAIKAHGMRNSNCMAIAPTATISNICGVTQSIEPQFANLFAKSNLSGEFTVINPYLVEDLRAAGLWNRDMVDDLKYFDGVLEGIDRIPVEIRDLYKTAFEIDPTWIIQAASRRQKWIDQSQSLNLYVVNPTGKSLSEAYQEAWNRGLKTTYYLRSKAATQVEKSTIDINRRSIQPKWMKSESPSARVIAARPEEEVAEEKPLVCSMEEGCEACQ
jgi:ribonucleoside-diphosphate reductase alpha chain